MLLSKRHYTGRRHAVRHGNMCVTGDLRPGLIQCKTNIIRDTVCDTPLLSYISVIWTRPLPHCSPGHGIVGGESERGCCDWNAVEIRSEFQDPS